MATRRKSYTALFKLNAVEYALEHGTSAAAAHCEVFARLIRRWTADKENLENMPLRKHANHNGKPKVEEIEEDDARENFFNELSEARVVWSGHARIAKGRALADIRTYHFDPGAALLPSKRVVIEGIEGSSITKELVIENECVVDEVKEIGET